MATGNHSAVFCPHFVGSLLSFLWHPTPLKHNHFFKTCDHGLRVASKSLPSRCCSVTASKSGNRRNASGKFYNGFSSPLHHRAAIATLPLITLLFIASFLNKKHLWKLYTFLLLNHEVMFNIKYKRFQVRKHLLTFFHFQMLCYYCSHLLDAC